MLESIYMFLMLMVAGLGGLTVGLNIGALGKKSIITKSKNKD